MGKINSYFKLISLFKIKHLKRTAFQRHSLRLSSNFVIAVGNIFLVDADDYCTFSFCIKNTIHLTRLNMYMESSTCRTVYLSTYSSLLQCWERPQFDKIKKIMRIDFRMFVKYFILLINADALGLYTKKNRDWLMWIWIPNDFNMIV